MKHFIFILLVLVATNTKANIVDIDVSNASVTVGDSTQITLTASSFEDFDYFQFDLNYDISIFSFEPMSFFSEIGTRDWDMVAEENADGMSVLFFGNPVSAGTNILAQFDLSAIADGVTNFALSNVMFFNFANDEPDLDVDSSAQSRASVSTVPEPNSLILMGLVGLGLLGFRRKA